VSTAREEVLARVRAALRDVPRDEPPEAAAYEPPPPGGDPLERFAERVADYRATVRHAADVAATVAAACADHDARRLAIPPGLPAAWRPPQLDLLPDHGLTPQELDAVDGALTGCALAIAETGTIVLDGGPRSGRRAISLVPDRHVCVVEAAAVVASVPDAIAALAPAAREGRPITLVSGPSATSDIELDRGEGVYGPRTLEVVVV
jgi:L-lactate dehydrogenase complex protein LldG